jgi:ATP-dependent Zn protease
VISLTQSRKTIADELQRLFDKLFDRPTTLLGQHRSALGTLAQGLLKPETLEGGVVKQALDQEVKPQAVGVSV